MRSDLCAMQTFSQTARTCWSHEQRSIDGSHVQQFLWRGRCRAWLLLSLLIGASNGKRKLWNKTTKASLQPFSYKFEPKISFSLSHRSELHPDSPERKPNGGKWISEQNFVCLIVQGVSFRPLLLPLCATRNSFVAIQQMRRKTEVPGQLCDS